MYKTNYGNYDKRKDLRRTQEVKMENHELGLGEELPEARRRVTIFGKDNNRGLYSCVYMIRNTATGKMYIGQTEDIDQRKSQHATKLKQTCHENSDMQMEYIFYGLNSFIFEIVEYLKTREELLEREKFWIDYFYTDYPFGYNSPLGDKSEYLERPSKHFMEEFIKAKRENEPIVSGIKKNKEEIIILINQYKYEHKDEFKRYEIWATR